MQSKRLLILKLLLVTVAAIVVGHYAVANLRTIKIGITDFGVSFVSHDYYFGLVSDLWTTKV
jgi:hypothetical protein